MRRIGITQRVDESATGERRDALDQNWTRLLLALGCCPVPLGAYLEPVGACLDALDLAGVVFSGGTDLVGTEGATATAPERDAFERAVMAECFRRDLPLLGICRGVQALNLFLGGGLGALSGHVAVRHRVTAAPAAFPFWEPSFTVNSYHRFGVSPALLAPDLEAIAFADDGSVEAVAHRKRRCWGLLWHPEREAPFDSRDLRTLEHIFLVKEP